ncbi:MAG TPA: hypothetical protein VI959_00305 [Alphaproteobacteria bacterium]|nr:hypothetical protein [Alphaproteobacteria bacterium]
MLKDVDLKKLSQRPDFQLVLGSSLLYLLLGQVMQLVPLLGIVTSFISLTPFMGLLLLRGQEIMIQSLAFSFLGVLVITGAEGGILYLSSIALPFIVFSLGFSRRKNLGEGLSALFGYIVVLNGAVGIVEFYLYSPESIKEWVIKRVHFQKEQEDLLSQLLMFAPLFVSFSILFPVVISLFITKSLKVFESFYQKSYRLWINWDIIAAGFLLLSIITKGTALSYISENLALGCLMGVCALGLHIFHLWIKNYDNAMVWFVGFLVSAALFIWPLVFLLTIGLLEPWLNLTKKLKSNLKNLKD